MQQYRLGNKQIESNFTKKELQSQVDNMIMRQHSDLAEMQTNCILTCISRSIDSRSREAIFLCLALVIPYVVCYVQFCSPVQNRYWDTGVIPEGNQHDVDILKHVAYTERQRKLHFFTPKKGRLKWDSFAVFIYFTEVYR